MARKRDADGGPMMATLVDSRPDGRQEFAFAAIVNDALDFPVLETLVRTQFERDETLAGLIGALGKDPATLDSRTVVELAGVLRRLAASTPRYRCAQCGFSSSGHFWQCPGCKSWDSQRPLTRFDLVAGLEGGRAKPA